MVAGRVVLGEQRRTIHENLGLLLVLFVRNPTFICGSKKLLKPSDPLPGNFLFPLLAILANQGLDITFDCVPSLLKKKCSR
jgi:hypothetical protein